MKITRRTFLTTFPVAAAGCGAIHTPPPIPIPPLPPPQTETCPVGHSQIPNILGNVIFETQLQAKQNAYALMTSPAILRICTTCEVLYVK